MRILLATTHQAVVGGVETYLRELLPALRDRGHELALLFEHAAPGTGCIDDVVPGIPSWDASAGVQKALHEAKAWGPEVIYLQGLESPALEEALQTIAPSVLFAHNYHGTCVSGTKRHAFPAAQPCSRLFGLGCLAMYYPMRCGGLNPGTLWQQFRLQRQRVESLTRYRAVLVASRHMAEEFRRHRVPENRLHLVPLFPPGQAPQAGPPVARFMTGRILMVGRLTHLKGGHLLVDAVRQAGDQLGKRLTLVIAGDGPEHLALEKLCKKRNIPAEFTGWIEPTQRIDLMKSADLLAVPSLWPEPFGLVGIEAGCLGLLAVAFAVGGIPDWLQAGVSGELAPGNPPTASGLAQALVRALQNAAYLHRLSLGAWQMAHHFTPQRHVTELEMILRHAAEKSSEAIEDLNHPVGLVRGVH